MVTLEANQVEDTLVRGQPFWEAIQKCASRALIMLLPSDPKIPHPASSLDETSSLDEM